MHWLELDPVLKILAALGGIFAVFTFWRTAKVRRAEWLSNLHGKFFETAGYKQIRRILDSSESDPELAQLREAIATDADPDLVEAFVDYLNFFEFVVSLRKLGQLNTNEIEMLFDYYLRLLAKHDFVRSYIRTNGFEELDAFIKTSLEKEAK